MVYKGSVKNSSSLMITNSRHKDALLKAYESINDAINAIDEETRNLEIYAKSKKQSIFYQNDMPESAEFSDVWIGD